MEGVVLVAEADATYAVSGVEVFTESEAVVVAAGAFVIAVAPVAAAGVDPTAEGVVAEAAESGAGTGTSIGSAC